MTTEAAKFGEPRVSVIIPTRSRPDSLRRCVDSVLAAGHDSFECVVVEQSDELTALPGDDRLQHLPSATTGKSAALNVGIATARGDLLVFTDDDCTVPADWISKAETLFCEHPDVSLAFGDLEACPHDATRSFVPIAQMGRFEIVEGRNSVHARGGAGANLLARSSLFTTIGGFDEEIGPGSRFRACEEFDLYYRTLAVGCRVARDPGVTVVHWGAREFADGAAERLQCDYEYGEGAVLGKHLRLGDWRLGRAAFQIVGGGVRHLGRTAFGGPSHERDRARSRLHGFADGVRAPVDRRRRVFKNA